jgi:hypothetical protein
MDFGTALEAAATKGDLGPARQYFAILDAAVAAQRAAETKVVVWLTASGRVATSRPKTPADAEEFAAAMVAAGKDDVQVVDK